MVCQEKKIDKKTIKGYGSAATLTEDIRENADVEEDTQCVFVINFNLLGAIKYFNICFY